jgi:hypothetical protein
VDENAAGKGVVSAAVAKFATAAILAINPKKQIRISEKQSLREATHRYKGSEKSQ